MTIDKGVDSTVLDGYFSSIADAIRSKAGTSVTYTPSQMPSAISSIQTGGTYQSVSKSYTPTTTQQTDTITPSTGYDAISQVAITVSAMPTGTAGTPTASKGTVNNHAISVTPKVTNTTGYITGDTKTGTAVTVSASELVSGTYSVSSSGTKDVTTYASVSVPAGTAGSPALTVGTVSNHSKTIKSSVINSTGWITGGTVSGASTNVSASDLVSGSETKTENGTYDVTNLASLVVNVSGGSSKNAQTVQGTTRTTSSTLTAIGAEMTVSKTGTYDVYWSAFRSNTSSQYTFATKLYINGTGYGSEQTTWSNHIQNVHLSNVSLTANDKIRVYGRESRGSSYYMYAGTLTIIEA